MHLVGFHRGNNKEGGGGLSYDFRGGGGQSN